MHMPITGTIPHQDITYKSYASYRREDPDKNKNINKLYKR